MPPAAHRHRASTSLRQSNKKHKSNKTSKRATHKNAGGKVGSIPANKAGGGTGTVIGEHAKIARALMSKQRREQSKAKLLERKRLQGRATVSVQKDDNLSSVMTNSWWSSNRPHNSSSGIIVPRVVGIISLSKLEDTLENRVRAFLLDAADTWSQDGHVTRDMNKAISTHTLLIGEAMREQVRPSYTAQYKKMKRDGHVTFLTNSSAFRSHYHKSTKEGRNMMEDASVLAALDLCRICDIVLFLVHHDLQDSHVDACDTREDSSWRMDEDDDKDEVQDNKLLGNDFHFATHMETIDDEAMKTGNSYKSGTFNNKMKHSQDFDHLISRRGDRILSAIKAQGLPTPLTVLVHEGNNSFNGFQYKNTNTIMEDSISVFSTTSTKSIKRSGIKRKQEIKKYMSRFVTTEFGENLGKLMELDLPSIPSSSSPSLSYSLCQREAFTDQDLKGSLNSIDPVSSFTRDSIIRAICTMRCSTPKWVMDIPRAYILSHGCAFHHSKSTSTSESHEKNVNDHDIVNNIGGGGFQYDRDHHELKITGFIRGQTPWNVNSLVHIPNLGTFGVKCIENSDGYIPFISGDYRRKQRSSFHHPMTGDNNIADGDGPNLCKLCDPGKRESLNMFADPNALEGEQNLVGFDDDYRPSDTDHFRSGAARPAGWSDYQASWIDALDASEDQEEGEKIDHGELAFELNRKHIGGARPAVDDEFAVHECDMTPRDNEKARLMSQRTSEQKSDSDFPDEVEIQRDEKARDRFARYRSIKSFRKTFWDPKENLPETYATIYHFASFKNTENDVMADAKSLAKTISELYYRKTDLFSQTNHSATGDQMSEENSFGNDTVLLDDMIPSGSFVTITIEGILPSHYARISQSGLITAVSLLPHENKISVIQMGLNQSSQCDTASDSIPIKSKDTLIFRCGWRTWLGRPIFSQNNLNSDKHKYERFMPVNGAFFASSVFGPVTYTPCPVLVFRKNPLDDKLEFIAHGTVLGADADRIVVKRIVLTGYPTRVHKRHAIVKYMFYNPEDVKWFKPAGLITKHGLEGNILESVGEHGTMKCLFNAPIKQHDTVCLPLYKRIFPKYAPCDEIDTMDGTVSRNDILVL